MKRSLKIFAVFLALGLVIVGAGGFMVRRSGIHLSQVYDIIEENIEVAGSTVKFQKAEPYDIDSLEDVTSSSAVYYQLNEFNTIEVYAEKCTLKFEASSEDEMGIAVETGEKLKNKVFLKTAVKNGTLYVRTGFTESVGANTNTVLTISVPENYKGGYTVCTSSCNVEMCGLESSMDMKFNLYNTEVKAEKLTAGEITLEMSGAVFKSEELHSRGEISLLSISSTLETNFLESVSSKFLVNNTTISAEKIIGGLTLDCVMSTIDLTFSSVTGNIGVTSETSSINIKIPHDSPVSLRHEESYSTFKDNIKWTDNGQKNQNSRYFIETNVKFSIVTLEEIE